MVYFIIFFLCLFFVRIANRQMEAGYTRHVEDNVLSQMHDKYLQISLKTQSKLSTHTYI
jgi:hypothetical protein